MLAPLPIVGLPDREPPAPKSTRPGRAALMHLLRVALLASFVILVHRGHQRRLAESADNSPALSLEVAQSIFPQAVITRLEASGVTVAVDSQGEPLGTLLQTSPAGDRCIGFSGPTNVLLAFDPQQRNVAVRILATRDTTEHAQRVAEDARFLPAYHGHTRDEIAAGLPVDAVTGATLTSLALAEAIVARLGGETPSLRFPDPLTAEDAARLFRGATSVQKLEDVPSLWRVTDVEGRPLGMILRGSPAIDNLVGYQGPTDLLIGLTPKSSPDQEIIEAGEVLSDLQVTGVLLGRSYDNEPYVTYVRDDRYFVKTFLGRSVADLAQLDLQAARVEGVSGATMTSLAVAEGLVATARRHLSDEARAAAASEAQRVRLSPRDIGTIAVTLIGTLLAFSRLKASPRIRLPFLIGMVGYLGFVNGDLVSQSQLVGWAQNGVPWRKVLGPLVLAVAALALPIATRRNVYCSHLCPHGAAQQLLLARLPWRWRLSPRVGRLLGWLPGLLLAGAIVVALMGAAAGLVNIEPFDAYVPTIAGWSALAIFTVGLIASLFIPMAYCRYGCPTGALLDWLRRHSRSDAINAGDLLLIAGCGLALWLS